MNQFIIKKYIQRLTKEDIYQYAKRENITLTDKELEIIYYYIKNKYQLYFDGHHKQLLQEIKQQVKPATYTKIEELYNLYKDRC